MVLWCFSYTKTYSKNFAMSSGACVQCFVWWLIIACSVSSRTEFKQGGWVLTLNIIMEYILAMKREWFTFACFFCNVHLDSHCVHTVYYVCVHVLCIEYISTTSSVFLSRLWEAKDSHNTWELLLYCKPLLQLSAFLQTSHSQTGQGAPFQV